MNKQQIEIVKDIINNMETFCLADKVQIASPFNQAGYDYTIGKVSFYIPVGDYAELVFEWNANGLRF